LVACLPTPNASNDPNAGIPTSRHAFEYTFCSRFDFGRAHDFPEGRWKRFLHRLALWGHESPQGFEVTTPILRPTTADLNMTLAMATVFMVFWLYWSISEVGLKNFLVHIFGSKGGLTGIMAVLLVPVFLFVGVIEVVSIAFRPVSLSLRLFGNVFAGENLLTTMITLGKSLGLPEWLAYPMSIVVPIPFYGLELLIGLLQAAVFMLLCAVYIQLSTSHDEEEH